mmetsp:Transcript_35888/g.57254  ORF Transcript_35888/g.57254 Transcript_35888/m.57254 type:complete len:261 (-) Transcript_35888:2696-3478(-)
MFLEEALGGIALGSEACGGIDRLSLVGGIARGSESCACRKSFGAATEADIVGGIPPNSSSISLSFATTYDALGVSGFCGASCSMSTACVFNETNDCLVLKFPRTFEGSPLLKSPKEKLRRTLFDKVDWTSAVNVSITLLGSCRVYLALETASSPTLTENTCNGSPFFSLCRPYLFVAENALSSSLSSPKHATKSTSGSPFSSFKYEINSRTAAPRLTPRNLTVTKPFPCSTVSGRRASSCSNSSAKFEACKIPNCGSERM